MITLLKNRNKSKKENTMSKISLIEIKTFPNNMILYIHPFVFFSAQSTEKMLLNVFQLKCTLHSPKVNTVKKIKKNLNRER